MRHLTYTDKKQIPSEYKFDHGIEMWVDGVAYWFEYEIEGRCIDKRDEEFEVDSIAITPITSTGEELNLDGFPLSKYKAEIELHCIDHWMSNTSYELDDADWQGV